MSKQPPPPPPPHTPSKQSPPPSNTTRIESKIDALFTLLTTTLTRLQSLAATAAANPSANPLLDIGLPDYTPLANVPPPDDIAPTVDARQALLEELKQKLATRHVVNDPRA